MFVFGFKVQDLGLTLAVPGSRKLKVFDLGHNKTLNPKPKDGLAATSVDGDLRILEFWIYGLGWLAPGP